MEIDPVILQLRADLNKYLADLKSTTTKVDKMLGQQEASARKLEREMKRSSAALGGHLRSLAGTLATYFTGRELVGLLDSFTRLQNNLRVTGVEGENMKVVQDRLFESAQRYGVELEGLSSLFSSVSQASKDLGASQEDVFRITDAVSASLKIQGLAASEAGGSLLQLQQLFRGQKVQAQEYNSLIDSMYPLLEAVAAGSDRWGGSVNKLTLDVKDSNVTTKEFFDALLKGSDIIENRAAKATLTLSAGFTTLTNALTVYFGEADKANGVSAALGATLKAIADNLDVLIPAIAIVATAIGARYVVAAGAATVSTIAASNAIFAMQARMAGAATTTEALAFAMNGLKGSLATVAILALGAAIYYAATREQTAADAALRYQGAINRANQTRSKATELAHKLASATDKEREATEKSIAVALKKARADQIAAAAAVKRATAELAVARANAARLNKTAASSGLRGQAEIGTVQAEANRDLRLKTGELQGLTESLEILNEAVSILKDPLSIGPLPSIGGGGADGKDGKKRKGRSGPSAAEIEQRFNSELASISQQALSAQSSIATSAEERAELELRSVELARLRTRAEIQSDKDYTDTQKKRLLAAVEVLAQEERAAIEFDKKRQLEREALDLAEAEYRSQDDALRIQYDLADSHAERKRIALEMIELEYRYQQSLLEAIIASETAADAEKKRAQIALDSLNALQAGREASAARANETPRERYLRELNKSPEAINESLDAIKIDGLDALNDGLVDAITGVKSLGDVFKDVANQIIADLLRIAIQRAVIGPLANALFGGIGAALGGGGSFAGSGSFNSSSLGLDSLVGGRRASGGPVSPGRTYLVGENGPELLHMGNQRGVVIPNHLMNAAAAMPSGGMNGEVTVRLQLSEDLNARIVEKSAGVAVQVYRVNLPATIDGAARETMARLARPRM